MYLAFPPRKLPVFSSVFVEKMEVMPLSDRCLPTWYIGSSGSRRNLNPATVAIDSARSFSCCT